jgi:hypothetical protein
VSFVHAFADEQGLDLDENLPVVRHDVVGALDGEKDTGWGVNGGQDVNAISAIFLPERPFGYREGTILEVTLRQESPYAQHTLGRFRLSVSANENLLPLDKIRLGDWYAAGPFDGETDSLMEESMAPEAWMHGATGLPGTNDAWEHRPGLVDGKINALDVGEGQAVYLYRSIESDGLRKFTLKWGHDDGMRMWLNGSLVYEGEGEGSVEINEDGEGVYLEPGTNKLLIKVVNMSGDGAFYFDSESDAFEVPLTTVLAAVDAPRTERTVGEQDILRDVFRRLVWDEGGALVRRIEILEEEQSDLEHQISTVMVMEEREEPRDTFILKRGRYDGIGERVEADSPASLPPIATKGRKTRLDLARAIVNPGHPLTARVTVNRLWQKFFGSALVKTTEDFGVQGDRPSHPGLLDWLAREFADGGWDIKDFQKGLVMSATYRQSSQVSPEKVARDPENRLLGRGPRARLQAETLRDTALSVSGLLIADIGGPSVYPYQAPNLWDELVEGELRYEKADDESQYRRGLYIYRKRSIPAPNMAAFDAPTREYCVVRREQTNTPLQALVLMNNPIYVEASRALAERAMKGAGPRPSDRIAYAFRLATGRRPSGKEVSILQELFVEQKARFGADGEAVEALLSVGDFTHDPALPRDELAAYALVASMILNLDESITKG